MSRLSTERAPAIARVTAMPILSMKFVRKEAGNVNRGNTRALPDLPGRAA